MGIGNGRGLPPGGKRREARRAFASLCLAALTLAAPPAGAAAHASDIVAGPVAARVLRVIDGDTIEVAARIWIGQQIKVHVRLAGVDAPEMHGRCRRERRLALAARRLVAARAGRTVRLSAIRNDKYGGRVVARVTGANGGDLSDALIAAGLAHRYGGGHKQPWCETAER